MAHMAKKVRIATNPHSSRPTAKKKGNTMATAGKKKPNGAKKHRKAPNGKATHTKKRKRPNPTFAGLGGTRELVTGGVSALVSAAAVRQIPQLVLEEKNTGGMGYLANIGVGIGTTWIASAIGGTPAARGAAIGAVVILLDRVISDHVSPLAEYVKLSGTGDPMAYSKLGTIRQGYFTHPNLQNPDGSMYVPPPFTDAALAAMPPMVVQPAGRVGAVNPSALRRHTANGMMLSSRFQGRFNQN